MRAPAALLDNARTCALANPIVVAAGAPVIRSFPFVVWYDVSVEAAVCSHARIVERSFLFQRQMEGVLELACTDLTHDVGVNLVDNLVSWAHDRSFSSLEIPPALLSLLDYLQMNSDTYFL
ncbi:uncharacterized protein LOC119301733 isoform X2 [Triticum dicoccoides]|nr:uncharacterized protein LOC119301733 isoform X2 [Triticum dicoccoides]XP_044396580.1 uncharacterized protein LOC123120637 isoform X2 [Triticum aestivum]